MWVKRFGGLGGGIMRELNRLSARSIEAKREPGRYGDGGGLYLQIARNGSRSWLFRFTFNGKSREMGLGPLHTVSLAEARVKAHECRRVLLAGVDPIKERDAAKARARMEAAKVMTFDACAAAYIEANKAGWKSAKHAAQWKATLETYASKPIGGLPVRAIDTSLVLKVIEPLWNVKPETANRVRGRIEAILEWAATREYRDGNLKNPARWRGHLENLLPKPGKVRRVKHHPALPYAEIAAFVAELRTQEGIAARALECAILAAARTSEVIGAEIAEFDMKERAWTIPAARMKAHREHRVPLSDAAVEIVKAMMGERTEGYLFRGGREGSPLSDMAMLMLLQRRMGRRHLTVHGFRSTFRTWAAERTTFPADVAEAALAHVLGDKTELAYQRGDLFEKRRKLMESWAGYIAAGQPGGKVEPIRRAA